MKLWELQQAVWKTTCQTTWIVLYLRCSHSVNTNAGRRRRRCLKRLRTRPDIGVLIINQTKAVIWGRGCIHCNTVEFMDLPAEFHWKIYSRSVKMTDLVNWQALISNRKFKCLQYSTCIFKISITNYTCIICTNAHQYSVDWATFV